MNDNLSLLITAFSNESPVRERAVAFFEELPETVRSTTYCATAFGYLQSRRGDLAAAEKWLLIGIESDPTILTAWLGLFNVYLRQDAARFVERVRAKLMDLDLTRARGLPREKMGMAQILRGVGEYEQASKLGYETVRSAPNDPEVVLLYFGLMLSDQQAQMVPDVKAVGVDTWTAIQSSSNERLELLIEEGPDRPTEGIYSPTHPFVVAAMGLSVGDSFVQSRAIGPDETWRVLEVKHKYLHMLHEMNKFNVRFPQATGLWSVPLVDDDVTPVLNEVRRQGERARRFADLYIEKNIPLAMVASMSGGNALGLSQYVRRLGHDIIACLGNQPERTAAERLAQARRVSGTMCKEVSVSLP